MVLSFFEMFLSTASWKLQLMAFGSTGTSSCRSSELGISNETFGLNVTFVAQVQTPGGVTHVASRHVSHGFEVEHREVIFLQNPEVVNSTLPGAAETNVPVGFEKDTEVAP